MDLWFTENHTENVRFSIKVDKQIVSKESKYQRIDVFDTYEFGRVLTLDGYVMLTGQICTDENKNLIFGNSIQKEDAKILFDAFERSQRPMSQSPVKPCSFNLSNSASGI